MLAACHAALQILLVGSAHAETNVNVTLSPQTGTVNDEFEVEVKISGDQVSDAEEPSFASSKQFTLTREGVNQEHSFINGTVSSSTTYTYRLDVNPSTAPGEFQLPAGKIKIAGKEIPLEPQKIKITRATELANSHAASPFVQTIDNDHPYVGEQLTYRAEIASSEQLAQAVLSEIDFDGFWRESYGKLRQVARSVRGQDLRVYTVREALFPTRTGKLVIPPRRMDTAIQVPIKKRMGLGSLNQLWPDLSFFDQFSQEQRRYSAPGLDVEVRQLPPPPSSAQKYIPVGTVTMDSTVSAESANTGDSLTLTITVRGDANLRPLELIAPQITPGTFRFYAEPAQITTGVEEDRIISEKTWSVALVPLKSGELALPQYQILCFDPKTSHYYTLETPAKTLHISGTDIAAPVAPAPQPETVEQPAPAAAPQPENPDFDWQPLIAGGAALLAVVGLLAFLKKKRRGGPAPEVLRAQKALSAAKHALANVADTSGLLNAMREYLSARFNVNAHSFTTQSINEFLKNKAAPELVEQWSELFSSCERQLFGKQGSAEIESLAQRAKDAIEKLELASSGELPKTKSSLVSILLLLTLIVAAWITNQETKIVQAIIIGKDVVAFSAPSDKAQAIAKVSTDKPLKVLDVQNDWVQVILPETETRHAWIARRDLELKDARIWNK